MTRLLDGTITDEEFRRLSASASTAEGRRKLSAQMDVVLNRIEEEAPCDLVSDEVGEVGRRCAAAVRRSRWHRRALQWAAVVAAFILGAAAVWLFNRPTTGEPVYAEVATARGERLTVVFQDGSRVQLNADSWMRYPQSFVRGRRVELGGEAYFNVSPDKDRPFTVVLPSAGATVNVTGTEFNVAAYDNEAFVSVALDRGSVEIATARGGSCALKPNQQATLSRADGSLSISALADGSRQSLWTKGIISFSQTPLRQVLASLTRWYPEAEFAVKDSDAYLYGFTLTSDSKTPLDSLLSDMEFLSPLRFTRRGSEIEVSVSQ